jgi:purine-cytosine permease-like protein
MRFHREARRVLVAPALGLVLAAAITACSSSSSSSSSSPVTSPSAPASSASAAASTGSSSAAAATIKANWEKFFNGSTPTSQRVSLLQNGQTFASTISSMSALGSSASAKVSAVKVTSASQATVTYTVYLGKTAALPNTKGVAVLENGTWKVSDASFCQLLTLQNGGKAPSVCSSAS